jgi:hypothetical protein
MNKYLQRVAARTVGEKTSLPWPKVDFDLRHDVFPPNRRSDNAAHGNLDPLSTAKCEPAETEASMRRAMGKPVHSILLARMWSSGDADQADEGSPMTSGVRCQWVRKKRLGRGAVAPFHRFAVAAQRREEPARFPNRPVADSER